jgi:hypothetical protein
MSKPQQHAVNLAAAIVKDKYGDLASVSAAGAVHKQQGACILYSIG